MHIFRASPHFSQNWRIPFQRIFKHSMPQCSTTIYTAPFDSLILKIFFSVIRALIALIAQKYKEVVTAKKNLCDLNFNLRKTVLKSRVLTSNL